MDDQSEIDKLLADNKTGSESDVDLMPDEGLDGAEDLQESVGDNPSDDMNSDTPSSDEEDSADSLMGEAENSTPLQADSQSLEEPDNDEDDRDVREKLQFVIAEAKKIIFGQDELIEGILAALVCEGHLLIEGMPGLGKTLTVNVLSKLCDLSFKRIQFTPDLLPSDLIGTMIYSPKKEEFSTKFGPVFTQILLADEINRSPAKVQSALLEAMAETQVTIGDETHPLVSPFVVLATQNPIDQEGTYSLPEAQLDRFMMKVTVDYPDADAERQILGLEKFPTITLSPVLSTDDFLDIQEQMEKIFVDDKIKDLVIEIVRGTRPESSNFVQEFQGAILFGASPRAAIWLLKIAKFKAFLEGADFVSPKHILDIVPNVLGHRIVLSYEAIIDKVKPEDIALRLAESLI